MLSTILGNDYKATAGNLPILYAAIDIAGKTDGGLTVAELIPAMNSFINGSRLVSFVAAGSSLVSIFLFPVSSMINILDAYQVGHKMYAFRFIAYTITAWAYDKPAPASSVKILNNLRGGDLVSKKSIVNEYNKIWRETSQAVATTLNYELTARNIIKEALKIVLRASAKDSQQKLCLALLKGFEDKMSYITGLTWKSNYDIPYPN